MLKSLRKVADRLLEVGLVLSFLVLFLCVLWQVFSRYVLNNPATFTEEVSRFAVIWLSLLGTAYAYLLQLVVDRRARELYDQLSLFMGKQIYQGYGFDLATHMAREAMKPITNLATGTIRLSRSFT